MADEKEKLEDITPTPWFYWLVLSAVSVFCLCMLVFAYKVFAEAHIDSLAKTEVTILMPSEDEVSQIKEEPKNQDEVAVVQTKENEAYIAIVIDDMGDSQKQTKEIISLQAPLTSSFLTYGQNLKELCADAQKAGHEIMIHVPMEPENSAHLAPDTLTVKMANEDIQKNFNQMIQKFDGIDVKGINNHMGSLLTASAEKMDAVMKVLRSSDMFFLDSKTTPHSVADQVAKKNNVVYLKRDVFLDNKNDYDYILKQLKEAEKIARLQGYAVVIGHPKSETYRVLKDWLAGRDDTQIRLVHLSELIPHLSSEKWSD